MSGIFHRSLLATLLLLAAISPSVSADLPSSVEALDAAIGLRLSAVGPVVMRKEGSRLGKAAAALERFAGTDSRAGFRILGTAGKLVRKSGTTDPGVLAASATVLRDLGDVAEAAAGPVEEVLARLVVPSYRSKVIALRQRAAARIESGRGQTAENPARAARLYWKGCKLYRRAVARGSEFLAAGGGAVPPGVSVRDGFLWIENRSPSRYYLRSIEVTGEFRDELTGDVTLEADRVLMDATRISLFPGEIQGVPESSPIPSVLTLGEYLNEFRWRTTPVAVYSVNPHRFEGVLVLNISSRKKPKAGNANWRLTLSR